MLGARGWRLQSFWPPISSGGRVVQAALAEYDGMCRPFEFNVFVFSQGAYPGKPVVVPDSITALLSSPAQVPSALPATGSLPDYGWLALGLGGALVLVGYEIRRASRRHSRGL